MKTIAKTVHFDIRYLIAILSVVLIIGGLYFKFLYDVPDGEEITNMWTSWLMVVLGIIGIMISVLHKKRRNPLIEDFDDSNYDTYDTDSYTNERGAAERP
jgi:NADH:ubiquinone oxidoreductase subunit H